MIIDIDIQLHDETALQLLQVVLPAALIAVQHTVNHHHVSVLVQVCATVPLETFSKHQASWT